jgi:penicillin-binding protein 2
MINWWQRFLLRRKINTRDIDPDEIFLDAKNLPAFDTDRFEGRLEHPIRKGTIIAVTVVFSLIISAYTLQAWQLQVNRGEEFADRSENNRLRQSMIFAERGIIEDRRGLPLAWNEVSDDDFSTRKYTDAPGFGLLLGYVSYPKKDSSGYYYQHQFIGKDGAEAAFDGELSGVNGLKIIETDALNKIKSESLLEPPQDGKTIRLSIDARVEQAMYRQIKALVEKVGFNGGAGAIMDIKTGELIALTSFPEYDPEVMTEASDKEKINKYQNDKRTPFLNRAVSGLYTPGSIMKPFVALGGLQEGIIDPEKQILSTGSISIPNPFKPGEKTVFRDWKAHGWVDLRHAIAVSSDVYFYAVGGGFEDQRGLGIKKIDDYMYLFGFGKKTGFNLGTEAEGTIPTPEWKAEHFDGDQWRIGNTYHTAIGQYGFQITVLQILRGIGAIANYGTLLTPTILASDATTPINEATTTKLPIARQYFDIVHEGMRLGVEQGTAKGLDIPQVKIGAKTGTAELGVSKDYVNSWVTGFFPYDNPRYAFVLMMEKGPRTNTIGATYAMRSLIEWMSIHTPSYLKGDAPPERSSGTTRPLDSDPESHTEATTSAETPVQLSPEEGH